MSDGRRYRDRILYRRLLQEARPFWPHIGGLFALELLATPLALLLPVPLMLVVDSVIGDEAVPPVLQGLLPAAATASPDAVLVLAVSLLVALATLEQLQQLGVSVLGTFTGERLQLSFRARLFRHAQRLSLAYHDARGTSDSTYRILYDAPAVQWISVYGVTPFVSSFLTLGAMLYVTSRIDWQLALVALAIVPVLFAITWLSRTRLRSRWHEAKELESSALSVVQEVLGGLRLVKAFGQEEREQARYLDRSGAGTRAHVRLALVEAGYGLAIGLTTAVGTALVLGIGARHVQSGQLSVGDLVLVMGYLAQLYLPLQTIQKSILTLQSSLASAERALALLDEREEVPERPDALPLQRARGALEVRGVGFGYLPGVPVLRDVSFSLPAGSRLGIAGETGAGKSTLVSLLTRFYDVSEGRILLDGVDLRDYRLADLRAQFGIVLQDTVLFSTSVAENIAYARPEATRQEIVEAARAANADGFISALPEGYETLVGERGMRLSGGERQRLSLARAFLRDAPMLILDEPTSAVDVRTEAAIMDAMERLMSGRTTIMIAHRLGTLEGCDVRLELAGGRVVDLVAAGERP